MKIKSEEEWKKIKYNNESTNYSISTYGRVRNDKTGRILKQFVQNNGYYGFTISVNNKLHSLKTARIVALSFIPNPDPKHKTEVNHKNGNRKDDNSIYNLEWTTPDENKDHALKNKLYKGHPGETNANSKYTDKQIHKLCKLMEKNKHSVEELIEKTGVEIGTIADIYWGARWSFISKDYDVKKYDKLPVNVNKKFSEYQIHYACYLIDKGYKTDEIIKLTKTSKDCVKRLRAGKTHKHISKNYDFYKKLKK